MSHDDTVVAMRRHRPRHQRRSRPGLEEQLASLSDLTDALTRPTLESLQRTLDSVSGLLEEALAPRGRGRHEHEHEHGHKEGHRHRHEHGRGHHDRHHDDCGCGSWDDCGCSDTACDCHCSCCVGDVDLAVYARVGEVRLVPIAIENPRKREQQVTLQLSDFRTRGGSEGVGVQGQLDRQELTLEPCSTEGVLLRVTTSSFTPEGNDRGVDVDDCTTLIADLRLDGCDVRPIRIGVVLLPRDCASYEVSCRCTCC